ncbi:MAG: xanthine dehydrogenase family protein subunit M [Armatimonadota bacterium]
MNFEYYRPSSTAELKKLLKKNKKDTYLLGGGTDLFVKLRHKTIKPSCVIDIKNIKGINSIVESKKDITIGAGVSLNQLAENNIINEYYPSLTQGAREVGSYQIRNRATLAGNICNASPAADTLPALLIYDAKLNIISGGRKKSISIHKFFKGPGQTVLKPDEFVESVTIPKPEGVKSIFYKFSRRKAVDLSTVNIAVAFVSHKSKPGIRAAVGACAAITARAKNSEKHLAKHGLDLKSITKAAELLPLKPISDLRGSADFRCKIAKELFIKAVNELKN